MLFLNKKITSVCFIFYQKKKKKTMCPILSFLLPNKMPTILPYNSPAILITAESIKYATLWNAFIFPDKDALKLLNHMA